MTVYVDEFRRWAPTSIRCFKEGSSHMTADTEEELHAMAKRIGLKRAWFQSGGSAPHYDLTERTRNAALAMGAAFVPAREQARKRIAARLNGEPKAVDRISFRLEDVRVTIDGKEHRVIPAPFPSPDPESMTWKREYMGEWPKDEAPNPDRCEHGHRGPCPTCDPFVYSREHEKKRR